MENIQKPKQAFGDVWVIECVDYIDAHNADVFERYIREAIKAEQTRLVLDFSELTYLASTGCNVLLGYLAAARKKGGDILIMKPKVAVMEVLRLLGLNDVINVVDDMDAAIAFFKRQDDALSSGELKVEDLVAQAGGSGGEETSLPDPSEWDGTKVPDPIEVGSFARKKDKTEDKDKAVDAAGADDRDPDKPLNLIPDEVVEIPKTPVEEVPEPEKKKEEPKKPNKSGENKPIAPKPRKERSKRKRREKKKKKAGKKRKKNRGRKSRKK
ncbi:MAG: anti-sigma factor antagonist [Planctomycetota bacterium]|nr:MAG: anti-sigma factor antagonist [Planctomycetota bacterium]